MSVCPAVLHPTQLGWYLPHDCDTVPEWRQRYGGFECRDADVMEVDPKQYRLLWEFLSNIWSKRGASDTGDGARPPTPDSPFAVEYWYCKYYSQKARSRGEGIVAKMGNSCAVCPARVTVTKTFKVVDGNLSEDIESVFLRYQNTHGDDHDLAYCDAAHHSNGLTVAVKRYLERGHGLEKTQANNMWKKDAESQRRAKLCGMCDARPINSAVFRDWEKSIRQKREAKEARIGDSLTRQKWLKRHAGWQAQRNEALNWLREAELPFEEINSSNREHGKKQEISHGLVFLPPEPRKAAAPGMTLERHGRLVLLDSSHKTNRLGWYLFTVQVRDDHGSWRQGAFFLTQSQHAWLIEDCLAAVKRLVPGWEPQWVINDDSSAEQKGFRDFSRCNQGKQVISLLCQKHWTRVIERRLPGRALSLARKWLRRAVYNAVDEAECRLYSEKAVEAIPSTLVAQKEYVRKKLLEGENARWASWARFHVPILLQVSTTSPLEGFHSHLKRDGFKGEMNKFTFLETIQRVFCVCAQWHQKAEGVAAKAKIGKLLNLCEYSHHFGALPRSLQMLQMEQVYKAKEDHYADEAAYYEADVYLLKCPCRFWRRWRLICACMWRKHLFEGERISRVNFEQVCAPFTQEGWLVYYRTFDDPLVRYNQGSAELAQQERRRYLELVRKTQNNRAMAREIWMERVEQLEAAWFATAELSEGLADGGEFLLQLASGLDSRSVLEATNLQRVVREHLVRPTIVPRDLQLGTPIPTASVQATSPSPSPGPARKPPARKPPARQPPARQPPSASTPTAIPSPAMPPPTRPYIPTGPVTPQRQGQFSRLATPASSVWNSQPGPGGTPQPSSSVAPIKRARDLGAVTPMAPKRPRQQVAMASFEAPFEAPPWQGDNTLQWHIQRVLDDSEGSARRSFGVPSHLSATEQSHSYHGIFSPTATTQGMAMPSAGPPPVQTIRGPAHGISVWNAPTVDDTSYGISSELENALGGLPLP